MTNVYKWMTPFHPILRYTKIATFSHGSALNSFERFVHNWHSLELHNSFATGLEFRKLYCVWRIVYFNRNAFTLNAVQFSDMFKHFNFTVFPVTVIFFFPPQYQTSWWWYEEFHRVMLASPHLLSPRIPNKSLHKIETHYEWKSVLGEASMSCNRDSLK